MERQSVRFPCEIELVKCRDRPNDTHLSFHLKIGKVSLGHVFFDDRYGDGKFWIAVSKRSLERFISQKEAVDEMFSRIGLEPPIGYCDV